MKKKEIILKKDKILLLRIVVVLLLLVGIFGITFAFFKYAKSGKISNTLTTGSIIFNYNDASPTINLNNAFPINDIVGKTSSEYFDFNISGSIQGKAVINYEIYITPGVDNNLSEEFIKVYLTNSNNQPILGFDDKIPLYSELPISTSDNSGKRLYLGSFSSEDNIELNQTYRLRIWIDKNYEENNSNKQFSLNINVRAYN
ncbi:MAG: hypothetical protein GX861_02480 [Tenericutes bacterium]|jgi:hypothetical protein|nr:hypothetical protein [Mycoplasmatota bacterium]